MKQSNSSSPVLLQSAADGGTNEVRVLLQLIQSLLNGLVDCLLDGLTHPIDLVHAPARLNETKRVSFWEQLCKRQCVLKRDCLETSTTNPEGVALAQRKINWRSGGRDAQIYRAAWSFAAVDHKMVQR